MSSIRRVTLIKRIHSAAQNVENWLVHSINRKHIPIFIHNSNDKHLLNSGLRRSFAETDVREAAEKKVVESAFG